MVAVAQFIPDDPHEKESVLDVLGEHPELRDFIEKVGAKAGEMFPQTSIVLDTVGYDEWDPPVRMLVHVTQPWPEYHEAWSAFFDWVSRLPDYNRDLIFVMPTWAGPIESYVP